MADNNLIKTLPTSMPKVQNCLSRPNKPLEYFSVKYSIDHISGLRTSKKSNSFRANSSANPKSIIQSILKKIKFSTRYKYAVLYFDKKRNSKDYLDWRKFRDNGSYENPLRIRVCRYKIQKFSPVNEPPPVQSHNPEVLLENNLQQQGMINMPIINPAIATMFYSYFSYMQLSRFFTMGMQ